MVVCVSSRQSRKEVRSAGLPCPSCTISHSPKRLLLSLLRSKLCQLRVVCLCTFLKLPLSKDPQEGRALSFQPVPRQKLLFKKHLIESFICSYEFVSVHYLPRDICILSLTSNYGPQERRLQAPAKKRTCLVDCAAGRTFLPGLSFIICKQRGCSSSSSGIYESMIYLVSVKRPCVSHGSPEKRNQ